MMQSFEIPGRLPGANEYTEACRKSARGGGRMKRHYQELVEWAIIVSKLKPAKGKVDIHVTWIEPNMKRDKDNIHFGTKFILDALVSRQIITNDGWKNIGDLSYSYLVDKQNPRIIVEIKEVENGD